MKFRREFFICGPLIADIAIQGGIWLTAAMIDGIDAQSPLVLTSARAADAFKRTDAMLELDQMPEDQRHRMFIVGLRKIRPSSEGMEDIFERMLEVNRAAVDAELRSQWHKRCNDPLNPSASSALRLARSESVQMAES